MEQQQRLAISAAVDGHRRAGRTWDRKATIVALAELAPAQLEMLRADPAVTVHLHAEASAGGTLEERLAAMPLPELRGRLVLGACAELDPEKDFARSGAPLISALERLTGLQSVSTGERDAAWADHQAQVAG